MKNKDLNYWTGQMRGYIMSTSRHIFEDEMGNFLKVMYHKTKEDGFNAIILRFDKDGNIKGLKIRKIEASSSNSLFLLKTDLFPQWGKAKAVRLNTRAKYLAHECQMEFYPFVKDLENHTWWSRHKLSDVEDKIRKIMTDQSYKELTSKGYKMNIYGKIYEKPDK